MNKIEKLSKKASEELQKHNEEMNNIATKSAQTRERIQALEAQKEQYAVSADFDKYADICEEIRKQEDIINLCNRMQNESGSRAGSDSSLDAFTRECSEAFREESADAWKRIRALALEMSAAATEICDNKERACNAVITMRAAKNKTVIDPLGPIGTHQQTLNTILRMAEMVSKTEELEAQGILL